MRVLLPSQVIIRRDCETVEIPSEELAIIQLNGRLILIPETHDEIYIVENRAELEAVIRRLFGHNVELIGLKEP